jgi:hypothetical protein
MHGRRLAAARSWSKTCVKWCLLTTKSLIARILPASLKNRLKSTALGTKLRSWLH